MRGGPNSYWADAAIQLVFRAETRRRGVILRGTGRGTAEGGEGESLHTETLSFFSLPLRGVVDGAQRQLIEGWLLPYREKGS